MRLVDWAEETARSYLRAALPRRWVHVQEVAAKAERLAAELAEDGELLQAAAWLHDVGYAPSLAETRFHPLDGARYLRSVDANERIVGLVAFHSSAAAEAEFLGLTSELSDFHDERTLVRDLLWYADMTVGPDGQCMTFEHRMDEIRQRYAADHYVARALGASMDERAAAIDRAEGWMSKAGFAVR